MQNRLIARTLLSLAVVALLAAVLFLFLDRPISLWAKTFEHSPIHLWASRFAVLAGHLPFYFAASIGLLVAAVDMVSSGPRPWSRSVLLICLAMLAAIAFEESVKYVFGRCRPGLLFEDGLYGFTWCSTEYMKNSFPSGHTTRAFVLAAALSLTMRRAAVPAFAFAALMGVSRIFALKHYPSDVLTGAWLGTTVAIWLFALWRRGGLDAPKEIDSAIQTESQLPR